MNSTSHIRSFFIGEKGTDFFFAVGTNTLGYSVQAIDKKVKENINNSNMTSLNCPDEVYLANKLITLVCCPSIHVDLVG